KKADRFSLRGGCKWTVGTTSKPDRSERACAWWPRTCNSSEVGLQEGVMRPEKAGKPQRRLKNRRLPNLTKTRFRSEVEHKLVPQLLRVLVASTQLDARRSLQRAPLQHECD